MGQDLQKPAKPREKTGRHKGILDPVTAGERFALRRYLPGPGLEALVLHYWIIRWDLAEPYVSRVLPHPSVNLAFLPDGTRITGVTRGAYDYTVDGRGTIAGVMFRPGGFFPFFKRAVADLTDRVMPVSSVFPEAGEAYGAAIRTKADEEMVADLESLLRAADPQPDTQAEAARRIVEAIEADPELSSTARVAKRFGLSERALQALFHDYVGVGAKWVIQRYRMLEAAERANREAHPNWTRIAHDLGFSDQAHFSNAFRKLVGQSPRAYARSIRRR